MAYNRNLLNLYIHRSPSSSTAAVASPPVDRSIILQLISRKRTSILVILLLFTIFLSLLNLLNSVLSWYAAAVETSPSASIWWPAIYASVAVGVIFGVLAMAAALAMAVPAIMVVWISILVLLTFAGKRRESVVVEGRKLTVEMSRTVGMVVIKEGNLVAAVFAILGYFLLFR